MSAEQVCEVIGKAVVDGDYRKLLFGEPDKALEGYELTEEERASLLSLKEDTFDAFASELEERVSKGVEPSPFMPELKLIKANDIARLFGG